MPPFEDHGPELSGRQLVFRLFLALWLATFVILAGFAAWTMQRFDLATSRRVWVALVVDLMLPFIAWQVFRLIEQRRSPPAHGAATSRETDRSFGATPRPVGRYLQDGTRLALFVAGVVLVTLLVGMWGLLRALGG